ncbi:hypothetical protein Patl1_35075 [Pistacia atlantica]|uniref:Uncharacterized protein n=1 Tax=Pistacia atlantica TaxID=434234 RepID=A0ACC0ZTK2_9ROSI|nr:hypothetical protein Patl1_35075 [Pistacia atlantica]
MSHVGHPLSVWMLHQPPRKKQWHPFQSTYVPMSALINCGTSMEWEVDKLCSKVDLLKKVETDQARLFSSLTLMFQEVYGDLVRLVENVDSLQLVEARLAESERLANVAHTNHEEKVVAYHGLLTKRDSTVAELRLKRVAFQDRARWDQQTIATMRQQ